MRSMRQRQRHLHPNVVGVVLSICGVLLTFVQSIHSFQFQHRTASASAFVQRVHGGGVTLGTPARHAQVFIRPPPRMNSHKRASLSLPASSVRCRGSLLSLQASVIPSDTTSSPSLSKGKMNSPKADSNNNKLSGSKVKLLRDRMWARETLEDITGAEFASRLGHHRDIDYDDEAVPTTTTTSLAEVTNNLSAGGVGGPAINNALFQRKKRAIDFDNLLSRLDRRVEEICVATDDNEVDEKQAVTCFILDHTRSYCLIDGKGMGSMVYSSQQREALLLKLLETRANLVEAMKKPGKTNVDANNNNLLTPSDTTSDNDPTTANGETTTPRMTTAQVKAELNDIRTRLSRGETEVRGVTVILDNLAPSPESAVTEDFNGITKDVSTTTNGSTTNATTTSTTNGSSDLVLASDNTTKQTGATANSPMLYVREDGTVDWEGALQDREALRMFGAEVWARINGQDPDAALAEEGSVENNAHQRGAVTAKIVDTEAIREEREKLKELKGELEVVESKHTALLKSGIKEGAAVANINLASLNPQLRSKIRESSLALDYKKEQVTFQTLVYELERIFVYLDGEMGNIKAGYIPLQDRLNVAEFGLLESQLDSLHRSLDEGEHIDSDVLAVVVEQLTDFKRRLGIDYYVTGATFDSEGIRQWLKDLWEQTKTGVGFYVKGCQLFFSDVVYCISLFGKALQGYTLKPREVRTLRRTLKDFLTFIPFVIILLIPLSPVGHVFVFGAIQRFFPDFFPSCFTERRQNLLQLYESTEYSELTLKEGLRAKVIRLAEAVLFTAATTSRQVYLKLSGTSSTPSPKLPPSTSSSLPSSSPSSSPTSTKEKK